MFLIHPEGKIVKYWLSENIGVSLMQWEQWGGGSCVRAHRHASVDLYQI